MRPGEVALVGAGPGDPELLTLRAARLIGEADDLVVDALVPPAVYRDAKGRVVYVGKRAGRPRIAQEEIHDILIRLARAGRRVVRLKGGDPFVFGRAAEEIDALTEAGIPYLLVPGISSALAAPAAAGIPVTERSVAEELLILTGHRRAGHAQPTPDLPAYEERRTVVVMMGLGNLSALVEQALATGYPDDLPAAVVSQATWTDQRQVTAPLHELAAAVADAGLEAPATVVLGEVARRGRAEVSARPRHAARSVGS